MIFGREEDVGCSSEKVPKINIQLLHIVKTD